MLDIMTKQEMDEVVDYYGLNIKIILSDAVCGHYDRSKQTITMPNWICAHPYELQFAYLLHEICHYWITGHAKRFKQIETKMLKDWGLVPVYGRKYVRELLSTSGLSLWRIGMRHTNSKGK